MCFFVSYRYGEGDYRVWDPRKGVVVESRDGDMPPRALNEPRQPTSPAAPPAPTPLATLALPLGFPASQVATPAASRVSLVFIVLCNQNLLEFHFGLSSEGPLSNPHVLPIVFQTVMDEGRRPAGRVLSVLYAPLARFPHSHASSNLIQLNNGSVSTFAFKMGRMSRSGAPI
jgi:hypothetical protein